MGFTGIDRLRAVLDDVDFPLSKQRLVEHAERKGADEDVLGAIRALPLADYDNVDEVVRSVPRQEAAEEGQTESQRHARGQHGHPGVAQHLRDAGGPSTMAETVEQAKRENPPRPT
ncbi:DUF2795 domain-containing protein [Allostreptomyces psammosilenae]|uniref:DUF2795 domain-containing protein n=1 Tax=Allostreptomyces psammosilenae TaxID=1892865 RepID=A0A852ZXR1_9ACTN|nr:DUF2795 domain-containing protein [Allostreptomyces psammosilenae]NYI06030.1 hypothetical protein [Allostreptomyces psammosilenae]